MLIIIVKVSLWVVCMNFLATEGGGSVNLNAHKWKPTFGVAPVEIFHKLTNHNRFKWSSNED